MLRLLVGLLLVANVLFWAFSRDEVARALGLVSASEREPERLARQVHPEAVLLLDAAGLPRAASAGLAGLAASAAAVPLSCLESGPLTEDQALAATRELQLAGVPAGGWVDMRRELPGRWLLYMGRFVDREQARRKSLELQRMSLPFEEVLDVPELSPGLVLGQFDNDAEAQARLGQLRARGVRTARVVQQSAPGVEHRLRVDRLAAERRTRLLALSGGATSPSGAASSPASASTPATAGRWAPCASAS